MAVASFDDRLVAFCVTGRPEGEVPVTNVRTPASRSSCTSHLRTMVCCNIHWGQWRHLQPLDVVSSCLLGNFYFFTFVNLR